MIRLFAFLIAASVLAIVPAAAQNSAILTALSAEVDRLEREAEGLAEAIERQTEENGWLVEALGQPVDEEAFDLNDLRQAQFEVDVAETRLATLRDRLTDKLDEVEAAGNAIVQANAALRSSPEDTLLHVVDEVILEWRGRAREAASRVAEQLAVYNRLSEQYLELRREQLTIRQRLLTLNSLAEGTLDLALLNRLRELADQLANEAMTLGNKAAAVGEGTAVAGRRRNLLRLQSYEALLRSNARQTDIDLVRVRQTLASVRPLLDDPSIPLRLFNVALDELEAAGGLLARRNGTVARLRSSLQDLSRISNEAAQPGQAPPMVDQIRTLGILLSTQQSEIGTLREELGETSDALRTRRNEVRRAALFQRVGQRTDATARRRIGGEIATLPEELGRIWSSRLGEIRTAVSLSGADRLAAFAFASVVLLVLMTWLRQRLLLRFIAAAATQATALPLEVVRRNLFWLVPVALWGLFVLIFPISAQTARTVAILLFVPSAAALIRDATQVVAVRSNRDEKSRLPALTTRLTEIATLLTATVVIAYFVLTEVTLLPTTEAAINRLVYLVFVLSGLPMLLFCLLFAGRSDGTVWGNTKQLLAALLALIPPLALIVTGMTGLAGYATLAATMLEDLAIAILIGAILALALGVLHDLFGAFRARLREHDPSQAFFLTRNVLDPIRRLLQVGLGLTALGVAANIYGWTRETPVIADVLSVWNTVLFTAGGASYTFGNVAVSLLAFTFVFWAGSWVRRVSYTLALRRLKDVGIRQSLSVFAQYVVIVVGVLLTLSAIGFDVTTLTVFAASLGVGIGFGLQNVVNNFISGILLLVERPLRIGAIVTVGAETGTVTAIGIRSMRMKTFDEYDLIVPNSALISDTFTNWTRSNSVVRVVVTVGISYDDDDALACQLVQEVLDQEPGILHSPRPSVTVDEFGDNSINLRVCYYYDIMGAFGTFALRSAILSKVKAQFDANGITIPFPQRDVHVIQPSAAKPTHQGPAQLEDAGTAPSRHSDQVSDAIEVARPDEDD